MEKLADIAGESHALTESMRPEAAIPVSAVFAPTSEPSEKWSFGQVLSQSIIHPIEVDGFLTTPEVEEKMTHVGGQSAKRLFLRNTIKQNPQKRLAPALER